MSKPLALIVDDEPDLRELLEITLSRMEIDTICAANVGESKAQLNNPAINFCLTDMQLPDGTGLDILEHMQNNYPNIPVAVITAHGNMETAIKALKLGAFDFVTKPIELDILRNLVNTALKTNKIEKPTETNKNLLLGQSSAMNALRQRIEKIALSQAPIFITGPSGSGKELVARLIHESGPRKSKPFIPVNCGAIPRDLMESEFFGHKKGSFTGAHQDKSGLFQAANEGTLFLDEVGELPLEMQVKLLRVIQEKSVRKVGSTTEERIDVRILSATHHNLRQLIKDNAFREDLFYRINVIELTVPSLHERTEDIPMLVQHVMTQLADSAPNKALKISDEALDALKQYPFPGNVRELENIIERAMTLSETDTIQAKDLQLPTQTGEISNSGGEFVWEEDDLETYLGDIERDTIVKALNESRWNKPSAAKLLGITLRTLRYRMKKLELD